MNPNKIVNNGLIFSDERYIESLKQDMRQQNISEKLVEDIISKVIRERDRWEHNGINRRKNEICFIYDLDYYRDYDKFLATYGGEFLEFVLASIKKECNLEKHREIIKMGKPYVIEFVIPFSRMETFEKQDVARYMLEEWIHMDIRKDKTEHQYDGTSNNENIRRAILLSLKYCVEYDSDYSRREKLLSYSIKNGGCSGCIKKSVPEMLKVAETSTKPF